MSSARYWLQAGEITGMALYVSPTTAAGNLQCAIFSDNANAPDLRLAVGADQPAVDGWNNLAINYTIPADGYYWLAFQHSANGIWFRYEISGAPANSMMNYTGVTYGTWPLNWVGGAPATALWSMYVENCVQGTQTFTPTVTLTATPTSTPTFTGTGTSTATVTPTYTRTETGSPTDTTTYTATPSATGTGTGTDTVTATGTHTETATVTATPTFTMTGTDTPTHTETSTPLPSATFTATRTETGTPTESATASDTATVTSTRTLTGTPTETRTSTPSNTATRTWTITQTHTVSPTPTLAPTQDIVAQFDRNFFNPAAGETLQIGTMAAAGQLITIKGYNLTGEMIRKHAYTAAVNGWNYVMWDGKNDAGKILGRGLYFIHVTRQDGREVIKRVYILK